MCTTAGATVRHLVSAVYDRAAALTDPPPVKVTPESPVKVTPEPPVRVTPESCIVCRVADPYGVFIIYRTYPVADPYGSFVRVFGFGSRILKTF